MADKFAYSLKFKGRTMFYPSIVEARAKAYRLLESNRKGVAYIKKRNADGNYCGNDIAVKTAGSPEIWWGYGNTKSGNITHRLHHNGNIENMQSQYDYYRSYPVAQYIEDGKLRYRYSEKSYQYQRK